MCWEYDVVESRAERHHRLRLLAMKIAVQLPSSEREALRTLEYVHELVRQFVNRAVPNDRAGVVLPLQRPCAKDRG